MRAGWLWKVKFHLVVALGCRSQVEVLGQLPVIGDKWTGRCCTRKSVQYRCSNLRPQAANIWNVWLLSAPPIDYNTKTVYLQGSLLEQEAAEVHDDFGTSFEFRKDVLIVHNQVQVALTEPFFLWMKNIFFKNASDEEECYSVDF